MTRLRLAAAALAATAALAPTHAEARPLAPTGCISEAEFRAIHIGDTKYRIEREVNATGNILVDYAAENRVVIRYRLCPKDLVDDYGRVDIWYRKRDHRSVLAVFEMANH